MTRALKRRKRSIQRPKALASALGTEPTYEDWTAQFNYVEREIVARRKISVESAQNF
jgi:hypothetical protein